MGKNREFWGLLVLACWGAGACDQELVIPKGTKSEAKPVADAPSEGFTGAGGTEDEMAPVARLPVASEPVFTTFGGAGAGGASDQESGGQAAAVPRGGAPAIGGAKGNAGSAGTTGGAITTTGGTRAGGGFSAGGEANGGAAGAAVAGAALLFSEYVEGSGSYKALEIYAVEASSLEGCELQTYSNGKVEPAHLALHGALAQGHVQVLCSPALAAAQPSVCDRSTSLIFNGDDALALSCGGELHDVIGQIGVDPGDSWGVGATIDHTLRRRCEVTTGRRDGSSPFEIDAEWLTLGADTFSDLGVRNCAPP